MAWTKRTKVVDVEHVEKSMRDVAQSWDEIGVDNVAYAIAEIAEKIGFPANEVLTDKQIARLKKKGII